MCVVEVIMHRYLSACHRLDMRDSFSHIYPVQGQVYIAFNIFTRLNMYNNENDIQNKGVRAPVL